MKRFFDWSFRRGKWFWLLFLGFLIGMIVLPILLQEKERESKNAWNLPLAGKIIVIDPGHGGPDGGAVSEEGLVEKEVTLQIAFDLRDFLQQSGALVYLTREEDTDLAENGSSLSKRKAEDLMRRLQFVRQQHADLFISIHLNAFPVSRYYGAQTFYHPKSDENKRLASLIQAELIRQLGNTNRLPKANGDLFLLKHSPVPTCLIEVGFLSNPSEARRLGTREYQQKIAASIYYGIIRFYAGQQEPKFSVL
jgi:N-acetylmuramoyl-L-alanine amidase